MHHSQPTSSGAPAEAIQLQTELEQLRQRLKTCEFQHQQRFAAMPQIIWIAAPDGSSTYFNPLWYEYTGLSEAESSGWGFLQAIHPDDRDRTLNHRQRLKAPDEMRYRLLRADGSYQWTKEQSAPVLSEDGKVGEWLGICTFEEHNNDEQVEQAFKAEARFRRVVDSNMLGILFWDVNGDITEANAAFLQMVGYTREDLLSGAMRWKDMTPPEYLPLDEKALAELAATGVEAPYEKEYIRKDGSRVPILLGAALFEGSQHEGVAFAIDLTERKRTEAALKAQTEELIYITTVLAQTNVALERRNQELDQFAYVASHDLKAPLRAIANLSQWIEEDIGDQLNEENKHQMQLLRGRVHRLEALIEGLLQYSRVGRVATETDSVDVNLLLAEVINSITPSEFTVTVEAGMPTLLTQRLPLLQVFSNLLSNAIKHHHRPDGKVSISATQQGKFYEFVVTDDGPGIAPQYHEKVFGIFQTLEARDKVENTGVGLAIVKKIVESQGGLIYLESELGQGATFRFTWPG